MPKQNYLAYVSFSPSKAKDLKVKVSKGINDARSCVKAWLEKFDALEELVERYFEKIDQKVERQCSRLREAIPKDICADLGADIEVLNQKVVGLVSSLAYYQAVK